jgi:flagellar operon protein
VDLKKVSTFENAIQPERMRNSNSQPEVGGQSFKDMLSQIQGGNITGEVAKTTPSAMPGTMPTGMGPAASGVKFSNHAVERMQTRGIAFNKADMDKLNDAVSRAASKGSKDTLVLMNDAALIVSVKNKTVVTVMDKAALKENVFTNIDSTIVM